MKLFISIGIFAGSIIGSLIGAHWGGDFGLPSLALGTIGCFVGLWAGYKAGQYFTE